MAYIVYIDYDDRENSQEERAMAGLEEIIPDGRGYLVPSASEPGTMHYVRLSPTSCDCKGFQYRGRCRHVLAVVAMYDARGPMASTQEL